ncbi:outer membrane lipoprotein-sorting protein [Rheinheimera maricola]|uniref:Outer membrane lipoprotein-sorting protein n=1 Tax=Rheinheimera maricola TaxID=2793282 RepID=A0ABS7XDB5_9GAMM|nr:outer membrane lipoprotein-sorting protein [Rheinheimera maricola]MBZ9613154.1 outer membrane lipoprotein-sorting protein [Rheinheimera maricola]
MKLPIKQIATVINLLALSTQLQAAAASLPTDLAHVAAPGSTVLAVLENMEYLRGFKGTDFSFDSEVITLEDEKIVGKHQLDVKISEQGYALIEVLYPKTEQGRRTLIRDKDLWLYLPGSSNVVRIAPLQRVFGSASIADVLNTSYLNGYTVATSQQTADGKQLDVSLVSNNTKATFAKIELKYDLEHDRPIETRHFTVSGRLLKTIQYKSFIDHQGKAKLEKIAIYDSLRKNSAVWIRMSDYQISSYPETTFSKSGLRKN